MKKNLILISLDICLVNWISTARAEDLIMLKHKDGHSFIKARDFTHDPDFFPDPHIKGAYRLHYRSAAVATDNPYDIEYIEKDKAFGITLLRQPLGKTRSDAEQYLMNKLKLSKEQMCDLNYELGTPNFVSGTYAGADLKFSFCPGAVALK